MQVVVMSDNHGMEMALKRVFDRYRDDEETVFVHCGDSEFPYQSEIFEGCYRVTGNCDYDSEYPEFVTFEVGGVPFYVTHGHRQYVNAGVDRLAKEAATHGAKIALYGHTHKLYEETYDGVLCVNSGSVSYPRGYYQTIPTYAVFTVESPDAVTLTYYTMRHEPVEGLTYHYHYEEGRGFVHD